MFSFRRYLAFFLLMAFVISCCMILFLNMVTRTTGLEFTQTLIEQAAKITFLNVILLSLLCTVIDGIRRKFMIDRPVKKLVLYVHRRPVGEDITSEFKRYRACGIILLLMNQALAGIVVCMVTENRGFSYPGLMIYVMAMYAFYITIVAAVNVVKFRRRGSPLLSAAKVISLTAALVSMLSLETAMLAQFGGEDVVFRRLMLGISGVAVCTIVLTMAIYMIARSTRQLKRLQDNNLKASC